MEHRFMASDDEMNASASAFTSNSSRLLLSTVKVDDKPFIGLKLTRTPSFLAAVDRLIEIQKARPGPGVEQDKMKAENFPISLLRIGSWQRILKNEGDLVAKCYFAKKRLVWEILEHGLKAKIEVLWSDILSLRAVMQEDRYGILEIELNGPPSFYREIDPQPRKHTQWQMASDFTGGQALAFRRHYLEFPPGALEKPLDKLFRLDSRLFQLSQQGFPTLESPYFQKHTFGFDLSFDNGGRQGHVNPEQQQQQQLSFSNVPTNYHSQHFHQQKNSADSPISVMDLSLKDEQIKNQTPFWGHGMNNVVTNQVEGMSLAAASAPHGNSAVFLQNNHMSGYVQEGFRNQHGGFLPSTSISQVNPTLISLQDAEGHQTMIQTMNDLQNMVPLNDSQIGFSNDMAEGNFLYPTNNISDVMTNYGQNMVDNVVVMNNNVPRATNWPQSQVPHQDMIDNVVVMNNNVPQATNWPQSQVPHQDMIDSVVVMNNNVPQATNWPQSHVPHQDMIDNVVLMNNNVPQATNWPQSQVSHQDMIDNVVLMNNNVPQATNWPQSQVPHQHMIDNVVMMNNNIPQATNWPQSQVPHQDTSMNDLLSDNNSFYSSGPTMDCSSNSIQGMNNWKWN